MVHHRRMIHEGGRLRKKEATATAAAGNGGGSAGGVEKMKVDDDEDVKTSEHSNERLTRDDVIAEDTVKTSQLTADQLTATLTVVKSSAAVREVYWCSFAGCRHKFRHREQLQRHEEKHAGPGTPHCVCAVKKVCGRLLTSRLLSVLR